MAETTAIVTVLEDANKDTVIARFESLSRTITDSMPNSDSNFKITCDDSELAGIKAESDIEDVISQGELNKLHIRRSYTVIPFSQTINPDTSSTPNGSAHNWGLSRCTQLDNASLGTEINLPSNGNGVNCVIIDTGVMANHPEFLDSLGNSRVNQVAWKGGLGGSFYTDEHGHGTHVAGIMCGKTQGWAKGATILSMKIFDTDCLGVLEALQLVKVWHKAQAFPTVINMSWGYYKYYPLGHPTKVGLSDYHPYRVRSVDAEIRDMHKAGIICVGAAGNANHIIDRDVTYELSHYDDSYNTSDWWGDNYDASGPWTWYYHRGSSPASAPGVICVGASNKDDERATFSNYGGRVDVYAPGRYIQSAWIDTSKAQHPDNASFGLRKLSGTSMSSPQVAGIVACKLRGKKVKFRKIKRATKKTAIQGALNEGVRTLGNGKNRLSYFPQKTQTLANGLPKLPGKGKWFFRNGSIEILGYDYDSFSDTDDENLG